jgi:hypothetical protein
MTEPGLTVFVLDKARVFFLEREPGLPAFILDWRNVLVLAGQVSEHHRISIDVHAATRGGGRWVPTAERSPAPAPGFRLTYTACMPRLEGQATSHH